MNNKNCKSNKNNNYNKQKDRDLNTLCAYLMIELILQAINLK